MLESDCEPRITYTMLVGSEADQGHNAGWQPGSEVAILTWF